MGVWVKMGLGLATIFGSFTTRLGNIGALVALAAVWSVSSPLAATRYVSLSGAHVSPFANWADAATNIQSAISASTAGDLVLVTNGVYGGGGSSVYGSKTTNRVAITNAIEVRSVNGPDLTVITGRDLYDPFWARNARGAYVGSNAQLVGFTITGGTADDSGGGLWCETNAVVSNCVITGNTIYGDDHAVYRGRIFNCRIVSNGLVGVYGAHLENCTVSDHDSYGATTSYLYGCTIVANGDAYSGGGVEGSVLIGCKIEDNLNSGAIDSTLWYCKVYRNGDPGQNGGGVRNCRVYNSAIMHNRALSGGGASDSDLYNCTVCFNTAADSGGGVGTYYRTDVVIRNCLIFYNTAAVNDNYSGNLTNVLYTCTTPRHPALGNIAEEPRLAGGYYLASDSPCIGAGDYQSASGVDIDGQPWANPPALGAQQPVAGAATSPLLVAIDKNYAQVACNYPVTFFADIEGQATRSVWSFASAAGATNVPLLDRSWAGTGTYAVTLTAFNDAFPGGITATTTVSVVTVPEHFVSKGSQIPVWPYQSWATAAQIIQGAVDACQVPGSVVWVSNGVYGIGGEAPNRVTLTNGVVLRSVNGPDVTTIVGTRFSSEEVRCVYLGPYSRISGFTLANGSNYWGSGGGAFLYPTAVMSNCVITNCVAEYGGGAYGGRLFNSILADNRADLAGGGAYESDLVDCILRGNTADTGGGAANCQLTDSILQDNRAERDEGGGAYASVLTRCRVYGNMATNHMLGVGGGISGGAADNCLIYSNHAYEGGGAYGSTLRNCTIAQNLAGARGGGVAGDWDNPFDIFNCVVYFNRAYYRFYDNHYASENSTMEYTCTWPWFKSPNTGIITNDPRFVDAAGLDFRLRPDSACIDRGINDDLGELDLDGAPRLFNGTVDMGAYEFAMRADIRLLLQGPYDAAGRMRHDLADAGLIPRASPYAADPREAAQVPTNAIDWVLAQLLATNSYNLVAARSAFLRADGTVMDDAGLPGVRLDAPRGNYYLLVQHRNHLAAMSAAPVAFTNPAVSYNFTVAADRYLGGTSAALEVAPGAWALPAADADAEGAVTFADADVCAQMAGRAGYWCADFDLDGLAGATPDQGLATTNQGWRSGAPNPAVALAPPLKVAPPRKTLLPAGACAFSATTTNPVTWYYLQPFSGGSLTTTGAQAALFQAGPTSGCIDVVEAWDGGNGFGRAPVNIISASNVAVAGKAVVVAGWAGASDPLWPVTDYLAQNAFDLLAYRGFAPENVEYLSAVSNQARGIDRLATLANVRWAFTNWVNAANKLFVYLVDHGTDSGGLGYFRLNGGETLPAATLDQWLDDLQNRYQTEVTVVIDCCYSGSLLDELSYTGAARRVVLAATGTNEPAYFAASGLMSFSDVFFGGIQTGLDIAAAFRAAMAAMAGYQTPTYYDNAGGHAADGLYLGPSYIAGRDLPQVGLVNGQQLLGGDTAADLWAADVASAYGVDRVWCMVIPPGHNPTNASQPVQDLPEVELAFSNRTGRYEGRFEGFSQAGTYRIRYYARDIWGSVSLPRESYVVQQGYDERLVIVAGGPTNAPGWQAVNTLANYAYQTACRRLLAPERIFYLGASPGWDPDHDGTPDVDAEPTLANLEQAILAWAGSTNFGGPVDRLTVYLVGVSTNSTLTLNEQENLSPHQLAVWLNTFQDTNRAVNVVIECTGAGAFVPALRCDPAWDRVVIAGCASNQPAVWAGDGLVSFSAFWLGQVAQGASLGDAFTAAQRTVRRASGPVRQAPEIDDNDNGRPNEKNLDGQLARTRYLGAAFRTGAEQPVIGTVMPDTALPAPGTNLVLWAADVTAAAGISNAWCVLTPPDYDGTNDLPEVPLAWSTNQSRYEADYAGWSATGAYTVTFFARDNEGQVSFPVQALVVTPDMYEPDNTNIDATSYSAYQQHTFHLSNDVDWVKFYALSNLAYEIHAGNVSTNTDIVLDLYGMLPDGTLTNLDHMDDGGKGVDEYMALDFPAPGFYYIRVSEFMDGPWTPGAYDFEITIPTAGDNPLVVMVLNLCTGGALPSAQVRVDGVTHPLSQDGLSWSDSYPVGSHHTVQALGTPSGFRCVSGNPQTTTISAGNRWTQVDFFYLPFVTLAGYVRDAYTGVGLAGVQLKFVAVRMFKQPVWDDDTEADGQLPAATEWPITYGPLTLHKDGYVDRTFNNPWSSATPGSVVNMGTIALTPLVIPDPPVIQAQPSGATVPPGHAVNFSVTASGTPPLCYQWYKTSLALAGATGATYSIASAAGADTGDYWALVTNFMGAATSAVAHLTVVTNNEPVIIEQPRSQSMNLGGRASFSVLAAGAAPLSYRWYKDTMPVTGATQADLVIDPVKADDGGLYRVSISNAWGQALSDPAQLQILNYKPALPFLFLLLQ